MHQLVNNIGMWLCVIFFSALTLFGSALLFGAAYGIVMETVDDIRIRRFLKCRPLTPRNTNGTMHP